MLDQALESHPVSGISFLNLFICYSRNYRIIMVIFLLLWVCLTVWVVEGDN